MRTVYYAHPDFLAHDTGLAHPECADRLRVIDEALAAPEFSTLVRPSPAVPETIRDTLALVHSKTMINNVFSTMPAEGSAHLDADTVVSPGSLQAALRAVAAVCDAVDQISGGLADRAFCAVRPPGHHAMPDYPMGFCVFNNVAVATEYARTHYGLKRVAIVDFDVHHGNGTQAAFYEQPQVFYASSHQWPHYPGSGHPSERGVGNIVNVALPAGSDGKIFRSRYQQLILPAVRQFKPDIIFISAGFDAHRDDPLASIELEDDDYRWVTEELVGLADTYCQGRIISALEGGYNLSALATSVAAHVRSLMKG